MSLKALRERDVEVSLELKSLLKLKRSSPLLSRAIKNALELFVGLDFLELLAQNQGVGERRLALGSHSHLLEFCFEANLGRRLLEAEVSRNERLVLDEVLKGRVAFFYLIWEKEHSGEWFVGSADHFVVVVYLSFYSDYNFLKISNLYSSRDSLTGDYLGINS